MNSYNQVVFQMTRSIDPELAEDMLRRMPACIGTVFELAAFMNDLLQQYPANWCKPMFVGGIEQTFDQWCQVYRSSVLPYFCMHRLPAVSAGAKPIYPL
uniref:Uncharacterized protein n=1 Tax=Pseudomonas phage RVTF4 TaxID=3236931 RepID=A0AB39CDE0_9VIRU